MTDTILYHGGNAEALPQILEQGLRPRSRSKAKSNWTHTVPSNPKAIYLTTTYPFHFAGMFKKGFIAEVDRDYLDPDLLCPDEDALEQGSRGIGKDKWEWAPPDDVTGMVARTRWFRKVAPRIPELADGSLAIMGTAAYYGDIPAADIKRIHVIDWDKVPMPLRIMARDTSVSTITFKMRAPVYQALTRWLTSQPVELSELDDWSTFVTDTPEEERNKDPKLLEMYQHAVKRRAVWEQAMADTSGLSTMELA